MDYADSYNGVRGGAPTFTEKLFHTVFCTESEKKELMGAVFFILPVRIELAINHIEGQWWYIVMLNIRVWVNKTENII